MWNYAELSHLAKQLGGPEALIDVIRKDGYKAGMKAAKESQKPVMIAIGLGCAAIGAAVTQIPKVVNYFKAKEVDSNPTKEEVKAAEEALKAGIKEYEESNSEENSEE